MYVVVTFQLHHTTFDFDSSNAPPSDADKDATEASGHHPGQQHQLHPLGEQKGDDSIVLKIEENWLYKIVSTTSDIVFTLSKIVFTMMPMIRC